MRFQRASKRHAEAVFELATRDGTVEEWRRDLDTLAAFAADPKLTRALDSPAVSLTERRGGLDKLLAGRVSTDAVNLARLLIARGRFGILPSVRDEFAALVRQSRDVAAATVTTPAPLAKEDLEAVRKRVEEIAGQKVELTAQVDASLLGGLTVRIGDRLIDASVRGKLERLRTRLAQGSLTS